MKKINSWLRPCFSRYVILLLLLPVTYAEASLFEHWIIFNLSLNLFIAARGSIWDDSYAPHRSG